MTFYYLKHTFNAVQKVIAVIEKQITFTAEHEVAFYVLNRYPINYDDFDLGTKLTFPLTVKNVEKSIEQFNKINVYYGGPNASDFSSNFLKPNILMIT